MDYFYAKHTKEASKLKVRSRQPVPGFSCATVDGFPFRLHFEKTLHTKLNLKFRIILTFDSFSSFDLPFALRLFV